MMKYRELQKIYRISRENEETDERLLASLIEEIFRKDLTVDEYILEKLEEHPKNSGIIRNKLRRTELKSSHVHVGFTPDGVDRKKRRNYVLKVLRGGGVVAQYGVRANERL